MFGNLKMFQFYQPLYPKIVSSAFTLLKKKKQSCEFLNASVIKYVSCSRTNGI